MALQCLPLPAGLVRLLSPQAAALQALAAPYSGNGWITLSGLAQAVYGGLMHLAGSNLEIFGTLINHKDSARGGFVNRNHLAGFLEITLAMGIGLMVGSLRETGQRNWRQFWRDMAALLLSARAPLRLFLVAMVVGMVMTRSRMGNTAFFASMLIAGGVALALSRHATRSTVILIASLFAIDIFIVGSWFGVEKTMQRIEQTGARDVADRGDPSVRAMALARDYPVFGSGGGTFYTAFTRYRGPELRAYFDFAHNDYIQVLAETGIAGLAFAIHSAVDFNLQIPANVLAFTVLVAFGWVAYFLDSK